MDHLSRSIRKQIALELIHQGEPRSEIGPLLRVSEARLSKGAREQWPRGKRPYRGRGQVHKGPKRRRAEELLVLGWPILDVAGEVGASPTSVWIWRKQAGLPRLPREPSAQRLRGE